jgi:hypothetical protein
MNNLKTIISITLLISSLTFVGYISNSVIAIPSDLLNHKYVFGPLVGITSNDTGNVDWVLSGTWRSILSNDTVSNTNENVSLGNLSSGVFKAAIEMIKPDGTARHTHTLTDFVVMNATQNADSNSTTFNGTSTISLRDGPAVDIPTTIQRSANGNVFIITIDPESVDYHFGKSPLIYGISANPAFMKMPHIAR